VQSDQGDELRMTAIVVVKFPRFPGWASGMASLRFWS
jgi:hypothetical protein